MNGTPRLRSAFPATPRGRESKERSVKENDGPPKDPPQHDISSHQLEGDNNEPLIPFTVLDAPTQRFYVCAFYIGITAWRLFDWSKLYASETDSLWLFMKWAMIDGVCLYGLPGLHIPWLEWSSTTMTILFLLHAVINAILMFRLQLPFGVWIGAFVRMMYDREIAISERRVKPASLLHNSSLILGKQIIHILPEGSAMLNPQQIPLCIDSTSKPIILPIRINQTNPISIEILRIDTETNTNETLVIPGKEIKRLKRQADKELPKYDLSSPRVLRYPIKHTGYYRLAKVVDESKLEVQRITSDTLVVQCPRGSIKPVSPDRCRGELSNFFLQVDATPPFKIKYSRAINREDQSHVSLTIHPENLESPLDVGPLEQSRALVKSNVHEADVSWARTQRIEIPVNETLRVRGRWSYSIDEIHDGCGNIVNYTSTTNTGHQKSQGQVASQQQFNVHDRPQVILDGCGSQKSLRVAKGKSRRLPIRLNPTGQMDTTHSKHYVSYSFSPDAQDQKSDSDSAVTKIEEAVVGTDGQGPEIFEPGLYSLKSVSTDFCGGEVLEPSSCLLFNPPEPELSVTSEDIPHQCVGNTVGLSANLELIGSPPFEISYSVYARGGKKEVKVVQVNEMRTQLEFKPRNAGEYVYEFLDISDSVYRAPRSLKHLNLILEQDVRPTAFATFLERVPQEKACIQEPVTFPISLSGEAPWVLEYDLVHNGKRTKHKTKRIQESFYTLVTPRLNEGGHYALSLKSVTDASGCRINLQEEAKIDVRLQRPRAAFGTLEGKRSVSLLHGNSVNLPLRLSGQPPWTVTYARIQDMGNAYVQRLESANDILRVDSQDTYFLKEVSDMFCPGTVDGKADKFDVTWIPRPTVQFTESPALELRDDKHYKRAVCEGDHDATELSFSGHPPFYLKYDVHMRPERGPVSIVSKQEKFGLRAASIRMETLKTGVYEYTIIELGDRLYDKDRRSTSPLRIQQKVNSRPLAAFVNPGKTHNFCKEDAIGDEVIPVTLTGQPPFSLEIGIKHHSASTPEIVTVPNINTGRYDFRIPHGALSLGLHTVSIRKVGDGNGCQRDLGTESVSTRVSVVDVPTISPKEKGVDFCVGDRISYTLAGTPPFNVYYTFEGVERKAPTVTNQFRRLAERPGNFTITAVGDKSSTDSCKTRTNLTKVIHALPSVRISKGATTELDIHEGGEAELLFEFEGTPPFEFTWIRSTNPEKGKKSRVLATKTDTSQVHSMSIKVSLEGTYEVVSIRDRYCGVSTQKRTGKSNQQLLTF